MIPHFFTREPIGKITNPDLQRAIKQVKQVSSKEEALKRAFALVVNRYRGYRFHTYLLFWKALETNPNKLWERTGFMHCTHQNFLLRTLLVKSGWFSEEDIHVGYSLIWYISPHQYLTVKVNNHTVAADPWNYRFGASLGHFASGFGSRHV